MDPELRENLRSYGESFDEVVDLVASAMAAVGYQSRHAPVRRSGMEYNAALLRGRLTGLGMLCLHMNNVFRERPPSGEIDGPVDVDTLAVAAEVGRLVSLLREAQRTLALTGYAAFELDGDIDDLAERFLRLDDFAALVDSARSFIISSRRFSNVLPEAIRETSAKLEGLLNMGD